ncbi:glycoside hydrolase [Bacillus sp. SA1-12]|uniref:glycoside hydrolase family 32 protein n=1 Tax=Bacillus sp. SA1-12 TaxID=1455638 RepID=UPI00062708BD|nr:glycoside hydrolase family 32 protein [Bacillus sp. SA1-12]KKI89440.1 glycoside hydrolase [Bacillus sp. SA1-12]
MMQKLKEQYRPQFHFSPDEKWMNDPNGMVFFNDEYHLFYQYNPFDTIWGPMHWGHAVSKDLIHWEQLPVALYPDEHGTIFSGSAVVDWQNTSGFFDDDQPGMVAIYTSNDSYPDSNRPRQRQSLAYSKDNGRTWVKYENNPVLSDQTKTDFRDPKVFWHDSTKKWIMILATGQSVTIYTSPNLIEWEFASEFGSNAGSHAGFWECPDLFPLQVENEENKTKWVMLVSIGDTGTSKEGSRTQYFIGEFDGVTFFNDHDDETVLWLDYGMDNYAGVSWSDIPCTDGRRIYIGWMSNWRYANHVPTKDWRGVMTLPREVTLISRNEGISLFQRPVSEVRLMRRDRIVHHNLIVESDKLVSFEMTSPLMEINLELEQLNTEKFDLIIQYSDLEHMKIQYDVLDERLIVDRSNSGEHHFSSSFPVLQEAPLKSKNHRIKLQLFIDTSSIEIFANEGEAAVTSLLFPSEGCKKLLLHPYDGNIKVSTLELTDLDPIWG